LFLVKLPGLAYIYLAFIVKVSAVLQILISISFIVSLIRSPITRRTDVSHDTASSFIELGLLLAGMLFLVKQPINFFKYCMGSLTLHKLFSNILVLIS